MHVNELTGEVSVRLDGKDFTLHATMPRVASLMSDLQLSGLKQLHLMAALHDPRLTYSGLKCLCSSGNQSEVEQLLFGAWAEDADTAILAALVAGMPEAKNQPGKHLKPGEEKATESLGNE